MLYVFIMRGRRSALSSPSGLKQLLTSLQGFRFASSLPVIWPSFQDFTKETRGSRVSTVHLFVIK